MAFLGRCTSHIRGADQGKDMGPRKRPPPNDDEEPLLLSSSSSSSEEEEEALQHRIHELEEELQATNAALKTTNSHLFTQEQRAMESKYILKSTMKLLFDGCEEGKFFDYCNLGERSSMDQAYVTTLRQHSKAVIPILQHFYEIDPSQTELWCKQGMIHYIFDWYQLPEKLQTNVGFGRSLLEWADLELTADVFRRFPSLLKDRNAWSTIIQYTSKKDDGTLRYKLEAIAPAAVLTDSQLMTEAVRHDDQIMSIIPTPLNRNSKFISTCLDDKIECLAYLPSTTVQKFPVLIKSKLSTFFNRVDSTSKDRESLEKCCIKLAETLHEPLKHRPRFKDAWFRAGLPFLNLEAFHGWKQDATLFLDIASWQSRSTLVSYQYISTTLKRNVDFMTQAIDLNPILYHYASKQIRNENFELAMAYMATGRRRSEQSRSFEKAFVRRARDEWKQHQVFVNPFLCGLKNGTTGTTGTSSSATAAAAACTVLYPYQNVKRLIAEFVGIPRGKLKDNIETVLFCLPIDWTELYPY